MLYLTSIEITLKEISYLTTLLTNTILWKFAVISRVISIKKSLTYLQSPSYTDTYKIYCKLERTSALVAYIYTSAIRICTLWPFQDKKMEHDFAPFFRTSFAYYTSALFTCQQSRFSSENAEYFSTTELSTFVEDSYILWFGCLSHHTSGQNPDY